MVTAGWSTCIRTPREPRSRRGNEAERGGSIVRLTSAATRFMVPMHAPRALRLSMNPPAFVNPKRQIARQPALKGDAKRSTGTETCNICYKFLYMLKNFPRRFELMGSMPSDVDVAPLPEPGGSGGGAAS